MLQQNGFQYNSTKEIMVYILSTAHFSVTNNIELGDIRSCICIYSSKLNYCETLRAFCTFLWNSTSERACMSIKVNDMITSFMQAIL